MAVKKTTIQKKETVSTRTALWSILSNSVSSFSNLKFLLNRFVLGFILGSMVGYGGIPVHIDFLPAKTIQKQDKEEKKTVVNNLSSWVKNESKEISQSHKEKLINAYQVVLSRSYSLPHEIREGLKDEIRNAFTGEDTARVEQFSERLAEKLESLNLSEDVETIKKVFREIIEGLQNSVVQDQLTEKENTIEEQAKEIETLKQPVQQIPQQVIRRY